MGCSLWLLLHFETAGPASVDEDAFGSDFDDAHRFLYTGVKAFFYREQGKRDIPFFPDICKPVGQCP